LTAPDCRSPPEACPAALPAERHRAPGGGATVPSHCGGAGARFAIPTPSPPAGPPPWPVAAVRWSECLQSPLSGQALHFRFALPR
jgi:hypothetical protein